MNPLVNVLISILFMLTLSCNNAKKNSNSSSKDLPELTSVISDKKMIKISGGTFQTFFGKDSGRVVEVGTFYMDETPVTNREFLQFLEKNPKWRKSNILSLYADKNYLKNWPSDLQIPIAESMDSPVTNVSWFAASAYAKSVGKRLPTVNEWEFVGLASTKQSNGSKDPGFSEAILKAYQERRELKNPTVGQSAPNYYGVQNMYDLVWEWTEDFSSIMLSGESRGDNTPSESLFCAGASLSSTDLTNYAAFVRYAMRASVDAKDCLNSIGFRLVKN